MTLYKQWVDLMESQTEETFEEPKQKYMNTFLLTRMFILQVLSMNW